MNYLILYLTSSNIYLVVLPPSLVCIIVGPTYVNLVNNLNRQSYVHIYCLLEKLYPYIEKKYKVGFQNGLQSYN